MATSVQPSIDDDADYLAVARARQMQADADLIAIRKGRTGRIAPASVAGPQRPGFQSDETADAPTLAHPTAGTSLHGRIATTLLAPIVQSAVDAGTLGGANPGESKALAATRLGLTIGGGLLGGGAASALEAAGVPEMGAAMLGYGGVGAAQGAASNPDHPIKGALIGGTLSAGLGAASAGLSAPEAGAVEVAGESRPSTPTPAPVTMTAAAAAPTTPPATPTRVMPPTAEAIPEAANVPATSPVTETPPVDPEAGFHTSARTPAGGTRQNLAKVRTDALVSELSDAYDGLATDPSAGGMRVVPDENFHTNSNGVHVGGFRDSNRPVMRQKWIDRLSAELTSRGLSDQDVAQQVYARAGAKASGQAAALAAAGRVPIDPETGEEELYTIGSLPQRAYQGAKDAIGSLFVNPRAAMTGTDADVAHAVDAANARQQLPEFMGQRAQKVVQGLTPQQEQQFGTRLVQAQAEAEAARKAVSDPEAADAFTVHAAMLGKDLPADIDQQPWFQRALARHQALVEPAQEQAALESGVEPEAMRRTGLGAYIRLAPAVDQDSEQMIRPSASSGLRTQASGASNPAEGTAAAYQTNYTDLIRQDAQDKMMKAAHNRLLQAVAKTGTELPAGQKVPASTPVVAFTDANDIVDAPHAGAETAPGTRVFQVSPEVKNMIDQYRNREVPLPPAVQKFIDASGGITKATLLSPTVAPFHAARAAANVETTGVGGAGRQLTDLIPFGKSGVGLARAAQVNFEDPTTMARELRLAQSGALRVQPTEPGLINKGANALFGPEGWDRRLRLVASGDFEADRAAKGLRTSGPEFERAERSYIVSKLGEPVAANRGLLFGNRFSRAAMPFSGYHMAGFRTGLGALSGNTGLSNPTALQRAVTFARGPVGTAAASLGAGYALSGHMPQRFGVALPLYSTPAGEKYFRGSLEQAQAKFGPRAREEYLQDPGAGPIARNLGAALYAPSGSGVSEIARQGVNDGASFLGPAAAGAVTLGTGRQPYQDASGDFANAQAPHLQANRGLVDRVKAAAAATTAAGALMPSPSGQPGGAEPFLRRLVPLLGQQSIGAPAMQQRRDVLQFQDAIVGRIISAPDTTTARTIMTNAMAEAKSAGLDTTALMGPFLRAFYSGRAKADAGVGQMRFDAKYGRQQ